MTLPRRKFLHLAASAAAVPALPYIARAETYPSRPIHLIIGYLPGGSADMTARLFGQWLSDRLGQQIVVESRAGASTNIATEAVVRAAPDGYTLLLASPANATNAALLRQAQLRLSCATSCRSPAKSALPTWSWSIRRCRSRPSRS